MTIEPRKARVADILAVAARMTGMPQSVILGRGRTAKVARIRQAVYVVARRAGHSLPQIGHHLQRDHSSVMSGLDVAAVRAERDAGYRTLIDEIEREALNAPPFVPAPREVVEAIPDKPEPPAPELVARHRFVAAEAHGKGCLAVVLDGKGRSRDEVIQRGSVIAGTQALCAALRREHPERFAA